MMRLLEFQSSSITMRDLINALGKIFDMERVGGNSRIYQVGDRSGVIFLLNNSLRAIGLIWSKGATTVQSAGVWNEINFDGSPDFMVDFPKDATLNQIIEPLVKFIKHPVEGLVEGVIME